ncbi:MAG: DegV family protein [Bacillota bacterium]|nr:DegV family protein [Bacillota bacterium]
MTVKLVTDSTSYIDENIQADLQIKTLHLSVHFPEESWDETLVPYDYFYSKIERDDVIPTSSQPALGEMYEAFKEIVARGEEVLGIFLSSKMSGTYQTALHAKQMILEEFPKARIEIMDSKINCMAMGLQVIEAAMDANAGEKMEEVMDTARHIMERVHFYFVPASLKYLIKGGRIGGASALIGSLLHIRPILYVNNGATDVFHKVRGTQKAVKHMLSQLNRDAKHYGIKHLLVHHISNEKQGQELAQILSQQYNYSSVCIHRTRHWIACRTRNHSDRILY